MKAIMKMMMIAAVTGMVLDARGVTLASADSAAFRLDTRTGVRESSGDEVLTWSDRWSGVSNPSVALYQENENLVEDLTGEGTYDWSVRTNGTYRLVHTTDVYGNRTMFQHEYATFKVTGKSDPPSISNVVAAARNPWDGKVDLEFTLTGDVTVRLPTGATPFLVVTATDNATGSNYVAEASALSGDTNAVAGVHRVVWDFDRQGLNFASDSVTFMVSYAYVAGGLYCMIDLSGGPSAASYPVSYLNDVPPGGWTDAEKTDRLVLRRINPTNDWNGGSFKMNGTITTMLTNAYYMGVFETTQRQWEQVTGDRPSFLGTYAHYATRPVEQVSYDMIRGTTKGAGWPRSDLVDAGSFLGKLRARTGLATLDLPTEARWEFACRAGTTNDLNSGENLTNAYGRDAAMDKVGRYWSNGGQDYRTNNTASAGTAAVGSYQPNAWGLYDMHGNVWEWCLDWFGTFSSHAVEPVGAKSGSERVQRGGGWRDVPYSCTQKVRSAGAPTNAVSDCGFRLSFPASADKGTLCSAESLPIAIIPIVPFAATDIVLADYTGEYDGTGHSIGVTTNAIVGLALRYGLAGAAAAPQRWSDILPLFTNVCGETVWVEASAPGYFTQTNSAVVRITPRDIAKATIASIPDVVLTGAAAEPVPDVTDGDPSIITADDYTVSYLSNSVPGEAWAVLAGRNNYTGTNAAPFKVVVAGLSAEIGWAFLKASGTYFAQLKVTCTNGLAAGVGDLRFVFADRIGQDGTLEAALWHTPSRAANPSTEVRGGETYRVVALDASRIAAEGVAATYGVSDLSSATVPVAERAIELYVHRRVVPETGNEGAAKVGDFVGYVCWTSGGAAYALPVVAGGTSRQTSFQSMRLLAAPLSAKTLNASLAVGVPLAEGSDPYCRLTAFAVAGDTLTGTVEVGSTSQRGALGANASVTVLGAAAPTGPFAEIATVPVAADGTFALPKPDGAAFFKLRIDIAEIVR